MVTGNSCVNCERAVQGGAEGGLTEPDAGPSQAEKGRVERKAERKKEEAEALVALVFFEVAHRIVLARHDFRRCLYHDGLRFAALNMESLEEGGERGDGDEYGAASRTRRKKTHKERFK